MPQLGPENWITSKEILLKTGISRATLNNYIKMGILPKPVVRKPDEETTGARQIGYFPSVVLERIERIHELKREGYSMEEIARRLAVKPDMPEEKDLPRGGRPAMGRLSVEGGALSLTFPKISSPAYLISYNFQLKWINREAEEKIFGYPVKVRDKPGGENVFKLFFHWKFHSRIKNWRDVAAFHMAFAKLKYARSWMSNLYLGITGSEVRVLEELYDRVKPFPRDTIGESMMTLLLEDGSTESYKVYSVFFEEGILFIYVRERRMRVEKNGDFSTTG